MDDAAVFYLASLPMLKGQKTKKFSLGKPLQLKGKFGTHNNDIVSLYTIRLYVHIAIM